MRDERTGHDALARSTELVRGRWFHTAIVAAVINGAVTLTALVIALLLLFRDPVFALVDGATDLLARLILF